MGVIGGAVSVNLVLFGLAAPFSAALMERLGIQRVVAIALLLVSVGGTPADLDDGLLAARPLLGHRRGTRHRLHGAGLVATVTGRWFVARRGLVTGVLTAAGATGQLIFLPLLAWLAENHGWRSARSLTVGRRPRRRAARAVEAARPPERPRHTAYGAPAGTPVGSAAAADRPPGAPGAGDPARRRPHQGLLAARRQLRRLRRLHQRPRRDALHPRGARPRHADHDGRLPARARRRLRHRRHGLLRLAHRPGRPAHPARGLLHPARRLPLPAAVSLQRLHARQHARLHPLLRPRLGRHRAAHDRPVPQRFGDAPRSSSAGSSHRTSSARPSRRSAPGSSATSSAPTTWPGTSPGRCASWPRSCAWRSRPPGVGGVTRPATSGAKESATAE